MVKRTTARPAPVRKSTARKPTNVVGHSFHHDGTGKGTLTVHFGSGATYDYADVPTKKAADFGDATSRGQFLHAHIIPHHTATKQKD
jgi:hypothetical protein